MWKFISLMLICFSANAAMFSCVDENGSKVLKDSPCEHNEKQQGLTKQKVKPSYVIINSTGEHLNFDENKQPDQVVTAPNQLANQKNTGSTLAEDIKQKRFDRVLAWAIEAPTGEQRGSRLELVLDALNAQSIPPNDPARKMVFDKIMELASKATASEIKGTLMKRAMRALSGGAAPPPPVFIQPAPIYVAPPPPSPPPVIIYQY